MDTKGKTVIQSVVDGANVGVEFSVKSTLNGKEVPSNVVFLTGEEAGSSEIEIYKTDGDGFELVTELQHQTIVLLVLILQKLMKKEHWLQRDMVKMLKVSSLE